MNSGRSMVDGRFELIEPLGSGGMGTVWRAYDVALHREVALKEVKADGEATAAEVQRERVLREARALARITHPNVVAIHHIVDTPAEKHPWIVMELVAGGSLADRLDDGPMTPAQAAWVGRGILAGLRAAHAVGVLHRDVKPPNVLLRTDGSPVLTDFGIAAVNDLTGLTSTGSVVGSLPYVAPERLQGHEGNPASDLWSLGLVLFAAVEGYQPMRRDTDVATLAAVLMGSVPPPRQAGALTPTIQALLVPNPGHRPPADQVDRMLAQAIATGDTAPEQPAHQQFSDSLRTTTSPQDLTPPPQPFHAPQPTQGFGTAAQPAQGFGTAAQPAQGFATAAQPQPFAPMPQPRGFATTIQHPGGFNAPQAFVPMPPNPTPVVPQRNTRPWILTSVAVGLAAAVIAAIALWPSSSDAGGSSLPSVPVPPTGIILSSDVAMPTVIAPTTAKGAPIADLLTPDGVRKAIAALEKATGGKQFTETTIYPEQVSTGAPVSNQPNHFDNYTYIAGAAKRDSAGGQLTGHTIDLSSINWDILPNLLATAAQQLKVPNPTSRYIIVDTDGTFSDGQQVLRVYISNEYHDGGYVSAALDGTILRVVGR
ncbi:protein kinase [Nocardia tengchongensis]|uniref:non-specific serine/threonine protein kinase n=1 Tax=Nocardia tengchongensis TaxID=2055889 RepID=A0ABX8CRZ6_9NOCA|nr:serine/threonine-protein kinase [Nocardia tengchongensis]QVI20980.1 protein kinase [Nocardia tengchongensis]